MSQNSIAKLLLTTDEANWGAKVAIEGLDDDPEAQNNQMDFEILDESIPYGYVTECL